MAGAVVSADARLGDICIINSNAVVSHDCVLGRNVHMAPGAVLAGRVVVGESSTVGMAATVYLGLRIGSNVVVQNGCHIFRDLADGEVAKAK
jgi:UDP-3-O-[3-hydroxymyristoyl] glucosamine N-acyltransferase